MDEQLKPYHDQMEIAKGILKDAKIKYEAAENQLRETADAFIAAAKAVYGVPEFSKK